MAGHNGFGIYCSNQCQKDFEWSQEKQEIQRTGVIRNSRQGRRYFLEERGNKCEICGRTEWHGKPIPLVLDHKDGNPENWAIANLRMICCNCDAQTDTYKAKNIGNGRAYRRERYHAGQSY
jgi:hypothetical protein